MVINIKTVKVGSDPEVFLKDKNEVVSSIGLIPGSKDEPSDIGNDCGIQTDNILAEYTFPPVNLDEEKKFYDYIQYCINYTNKLLKRKGVKVQIQSSAHVNRKYLNNKQAQEFGCSPDFNVWLKRTNDSPDNKTDLRTAGCHIHIGYENPKEETSEEIVKAFDLFLAIPSLFIDKDTERRKMYGKAGCFRFKDYGVEYRVLGNFIIESQENINWLFRNIKRALDFVNSEVSLDSEMNNIMEAINNNNLDIANLLVNKYHLETEVKQTVK